MKEKAGNMNLVIDYGNTTIKTAVFSDEKMVDRFTIEKNDSYHIFDIFTSYPAIMHVLLSAVSDYPPSLVEKLKNSGLDFMILDHTTALPVKNQYSTKESLGFDRVANVVAAHTIFPGNNVLVIDAGTAITYDLITSNAEYIGGNISPGIKMRAKALHAFTRKLPMIEVNGEQPLIGNSTAEAIAAGIVNGVVYETQGYIDQLKKDYKDLKVILTGGDHNHFDKKLKNSIFVDSNLNLIGLNRILNYNAT